MANGLLDEIFVALGFKVDDKKVKDFDNSLKETIGSLRRLGAMAAGTIVALDRMTNSMLRLNQAYMSFNQQTGISINSLNRVAGAAMLSNYNMSAETVMSSMQALQSNLAAIRLGQGNIAPFQMLGISPVGKDAEQIIDDLRIAIQGLDDMTAVNMIQQMGLSPEFISLLRLTRDEADQFAAAMAQFQLSTEDRNAMNQFALQLRLVHAEMAYFKDKALIAVGPHLIRLLDNFNAIVEVLIKYRGLLTWLSVGGVAALMKMNGAIKILGITINTTFGKWLAALTAIYLILEDIAVWKTGGQSLIGDLYEWSQRGLKNDEDAAQTDDLYEEIYDQKRTDLAKYADWLGRGGFIGTFMGGGQQTNDFYQKMLQSRGGGALGSLSSSQNINQTNYLTVNSGQPVEALAQNTTNLLFTLLQADGRY